MFFTAVQPQFRRSTCAPAGRTWERFLSESILGGIQTSPRFGQDETGFTLSLDVPGITREQLGISIEGAVLRLQSKEDAPRKYRAAWEFPQEVDAALSEARLENGVLTIRLAKKTPVNNATEINIQ